MPIYCFLVFNFEFYFLQRYCTKVASLCAIRATLLQCAKRLLATLWQILQRVLTTFANSPYLPEGGQHSLILGQRVLDNLYTHLQEGCPRNKERGKLFAIPLKKLKVKINIQEATDSLKKL